MSSIVKQISCIKRTINVQMCILSAPLCSRLPPSYVEAMLVVHLSQMSFTVQN